MKTQIITRKSPFTEVKETKKIYATR